MINTDTESETHYKKNKKVNLDSSSDEEPLPPLKKRVTQFDQSEEQVSFYSLSIFI